MARGFTVIEIVLVVIIMAVLAALAVPNFAKGFDGFQLRQAASDIKAQARWAQAMAMAQQRVYRLTIDAEEGCYSLEREKDKTSPDGSPSYEAVPGSPGRKHCVPEEVKFSSDAAQVRLNPDGTIDPATIQLERGKRALILSSALKQGALIEFNAE